MNLDKPTQNQFQQAQAVLQDILNDYDSTLDTKKASAVRQLVIRPYAYIYAQIDKYISNRLQQSSIAYLLTSNETQNTTADLVASNYFVSRRQSKYARGIVTAKSTMSSIRVSKNTTFIIDGNPFIVQKTVLGMPQPLDDTNQINYIKTIQLGSFYVCNIPVRAQNSGLLQIPQGVQVTSPSYIAGVQEFMLTSPVTGGAQDQTDAAMMRRCIKKCGASVGTQNAIWTRLQQAPIQVISCKSQGSNQAGCFRARYNNLDIPVGGIVDTYVKTQNQASYTDLILTATNNQLVIDSKKYPTVSGFIRIAGVKIQDQNSTATQPSYTVQYTTESNKSSQGARLSQYQKAIITFSQSMAGKTARVSVMYMPGLAEIQDYINSQDVSFIGQDILVKAAVPVTLIIEGSIQSSTQISEQTLRQMRQYIASYINTYQVGTSKLNMDDVARGFRYAYPDANLKLPYNIQVLVPMTNGGYYTFNDNTGVVDLTFRNGLYFWNTATYFFSTTAEQLKLNIL